MSGLVELNLQYYFDPLKSKAIALGSVFIGEPDLDPTVEANRKTVTLIQEDGTVTEILPAAQPLSTNSGGGISINGSPSRVFVEGNYAITVKRKDDTIAYAITNAFAQPVSSTNQQVIDLTTTVGSLSFPSATIGFTIVSNFFDGARTDTSGSTFSFTGTTTPAKAGQVPNVDGFFYDADGKQFQCMSRPLYINMFGARPAAAFNNVLAIESCAVSIGSGVIYASLGRYEMSTTAEIPVRVYINGLTGGVDSSGDMSEGVWFASQVGGSYTSDNGSEKFLFFMNVLRSDPTIWVQPFPNIGAGGASNLGIDGTDQNCSGFLFGGGYEFDNIRAAQIKTAIKAIDSLYQDHMKITRIHGYLRADQTSFFIILNCLGDNLVVAGISSGFTGSETGITKGVSIGNTRGGHLTNLINGSHLIRAATALDISGLHQEGGNITIDDSNVNIRASIFFLDEDLNIPIICQSTSNTTGERYQVVIENIEFARTMNNTMGWPSTEIPDIDIPDVGTNVVIGLGNRRTRSISGEVGRKQEMGIIVRNSSNSIADWQNYSHLLSMQGGQVNASHTGLTFSSYDFQQTFGGFGTVTAETIAGVTWRAASYTYFYGIQLLIDPVRLLGKTADTLEEVSISLSNGGDIANLSINLNTIKTFGGYILRLYRGTSTGSYDHIINIPCINVKVLLDDGIALNGFPWVARTAGPLDPLNAKAWSGPAQYSDNRILISGDSGQPTAGTWKKGDTVTRTNTTIDGNNMHLRGYYRLTTGSGHISLTDWAPEQVSTVSPAT